MKSHALYIKMRYKCKHPVLQHKTCFGVKKMVSTQKSIGPKKMKNLPNLFNNVVHKWVLPLPDKFLKH